MRMHEFMKVRPMDLNAWYTEHTEYKAVIMLTAVSLYSGIVLFVNKRGVITASG